MHVLGEKGAIIPVWAKNGANEHIVVWDGINYEERKIEFPAKGKSTCEQMKKFISDIENDNDLKEHLEDVRKSTEMALGALLSETRNEIIKFPLSEKDTAELRQLITRK
jgi:hypothetical protein